MEKMTEKKFSRFEIVFTALYVIFIVVGVLTGFGAFSGTTVVIDAGHGGNDPGAMYGGVNEKDVNLSVAEMTEKILKNSGYRVIMTRSEDEFIELSERAAIANRNNADVFVSIHCNASENTSTYGIETYSARGSTKGAELSNVVHKAVLAATGADDRGQYRRGFVVLKATSCPAVLVEIGFLSNDAEREKLTQKSYQKKIARGIAKGVAGYNKL